MNQLIPDRLFHGGVPGLRPGDLIQPGHRRRTHDGCAWCAAREAEAMGPEWDGPSAHQDRVYLTGHRLYAKHYASLWGRGDLYRVDPVGELAQSDEDTIESWTAPQARVVAVIDRAVLLTMSERRRLLREWTTADAATLAARGQR